jgi:hypothetical protein
MPVYSPTLIRALGAPVVAALACLGVATEAHAALPTLLPSLDIGWSGLHIGDLLAGVAGSVRGCLTEVGLLGSFWGAVDPTLAPGACGDGGSLLLDIAFLSLLVIAVIAVVRIRQRTEQNRLELARQYIEKGMEPPQSLFPSAAGNDLRRGIVLVFTGLGLLCASLVASGWSHGVQGLGPAGLIPGFIGLGYLVSYACAMRGKIHS